MQPLIDGHYLLERFEGKGGWTYVAVPLVDTGSKMPFGMVRLSGSVDGYDLYKIHVMPMGDGRLMLPVKAGIRKAIKKNAGDKVHVLLFADETPLEIPGELLLYLSDDPQAEKAFLSLTEGQQKMYIDWIYAARREETKINRIAQMMNRVIAGKKYPGS
jgi:hypothetical protein